MLTIETKELEIGKELKRKLDMICKFSGVKAKYQNGNIKSIKGTNIAYIKPHIIKINDIEYLMFDDYDYIFVNGYKNKIMFKDLENYIKTKSNS